jgi:hypothetical protein
MEEKEEEVKTQIIAPISSVINYLNSLECDEVYI